MLKNDKKRAEYDLTYKPSKKTFEYNKAEDANSFKFDYKKAKQEKDRTIFIKVYYIIVQFSNELLVSLNCLILISPVS